MSESDDPTTDTDEETPDERAKRKRKTTEKPKDKCLRLPCQDPALISTEEFSRALLPQKYNKYMTSEILLPRCWSRNLPSQYRHITAWP